MSKYANVDDFFNANPKPDIKRFVDANFEIVEAIYKTLEEKGWSIANLADKMGISEDDAKNMLSGVYNITLRQITDIEIVLGKNIITVSY